VIETADCVVVGAGVVGLAVARALALAGREVLVLEAAGMIGTGTSSRNSEVIHGGMYYPTNSLKAQLCVAGRQFLYRYCIEHGVEHRRLEKLIVATAEEQLPYLTEIHQQGLTNGVSDLTIIDAATAHKMEPNLHCVMAVHSPSTGVIDSHGLMLAYQGDLEMRGGMVVFNSAVRGGQISESAIDIEVVSNDDQPFRLRCRSLVNSAGLYAHTVARDLEGLAPSTIPAIQYAKGNYFSLTTRSPFTRLIYPVPEKGGLGVHITHDLGGQARFGPDVEWIDSINYDVDPARADKFYAAIRTYWPALPDNSLIPAYSGIRPKLGAGSVTTTDFVIQGPEVHGVRGLVNLFGIESPGLTASPAIADLVVQLLAA
jgi:L-2-hydroxyglutarate oxidase LhgO